MKPRQDDPLALEQHSPMSLVLGTGNVWMILFLLGLHHRVGMCLLPSSSYTIQYCGPRLELTQFFLRDAHPPALPQRKPPVCVVVHTGMLVGIPPLFTLLPHIRGSSS
jgi:hypothetical protein